MFSKWKILEFTQEIEIPDPPKTPPTVDERFGAVARCIELLFSEPSNEKYYNSPSPEELIAIIRGEPK